MSTPTDNGGPAFPHPATRDLNGEIIFHGSTGMSLRDYAEIHFISALIASPRDPIGADRQITAETFIHLGKGAAERWLKARQERV